MELIVKLLAISYGIILFGVFIFMIRSKSVKPFYSTLWLVVCLFMFSFVIFEKQYQWIAGALHIQNATFLIIVGLISFLMLYVLYISIKISEMSNKIQDLISYTSILEHKLRKISAPEEIEKIK
jgi:hypothetical protein